MNFYYIALGALYGALGVLLLASLASAMLSSRISRDEERPLGSYSQTDK